MNINLSLVISLVSLGLSLVTAWLTWFHRGTIKMTHPALVFFGPDDIGKAKIYLRTLLHSTSRRGQIIESMFLKVSRGDGVQQFNVWMYGQTNALVVGGGLFVGYEGVAANHHFVLPPSSPEYQFLEGPYLIEAFAKLANSKGFIPLWKHEVTLDAAEEMVMIDGNAGLQFHWDPTARVYQHRLDTEGGREQMGQGGSESIQQTCRLLTR